MTRHTRYFTPEWERQFRNAAHKIFFNHPELVDDAFQSAWLALLEKLQHDSAQEDLSDAYVYTIFKNLLKDEYRDHFGRCRPFEWVKRLGSFWERVAKVLCQENLPAPLIAEQVCCRPADDPAVDDVPCVDKVEHIVGELKERPFCSNKVREEQWPEELDPGVDNNPGDRMSEQEMALLLHLILPSGNNAPSAIDPDALRQSILQQWSSLSEAIASALSDDDIKALTLIFVDGHSVTESARRLNVPSYTFRYQLKKTLETLHRTLKRFGIDFDGLL